MMFVVLWMAGRQRGGKYRRMHIKEGEIGMGLRTGEVLGNTEERGCADGPGDSPCRAVLQK